MGHPVFYQLLCVVGPVLNPENYMIASPWHHFICCEISFFIKSNMWNTMLMNKAFYQSTAGRAGRSLVEGMQAPSGICGYLHDLPKGRRPDPSAVPWPVGLPVTDKRTTHTGALRARGPAQPWPHPVPPDPTQDDSWKVLRVLQKLPPSVTGLAWPCRTRAFCRSPGVGSVFSGLFLFSHLQCPPHPSSRHPG